MKKTILLSIFGILFFNNCFIFDYNGEATVIVRNIGELTIYSKLETAYSLIDPGEEETYELTWPGHNDYNLNLLTYPYLHPEAGESANFWISDGETRIFEIKYYIEDVE